MGVVTINLPQIAIIANKDMGKFWELLEERLNLCYRALLCRYNRLKGTPSDASPIHWQHGALGRLKPGEVIDPLLESGYASISLGYIGIYEMTKLMLGVSQTDPEGKKFALEVMDRLESACARWKEKTGLGFSVYGTPSESTCYNLARKDTEQFGIIKDVTDKGYYTNSFHVDVRENIDAFSKFLVEAEFSAKSKGGNISFIEIPNLTQNMEAMYDLIKFRYEHVQYSEYNTRADICGNCGFQGEIKVNDNIEWECPNCHCKDRSKLTVVRRTCGYIGSNFWNLGKTKEMKQRVLHL